MTTATAPAKSPKSRKPVAVPAAPGEDAPLYRSNDPISPFKSTTKKQEKPAVKTQTPKAAEQTAPAPKTEPKATKSAATAPKAPKPEIDRLAKVVESQSSPTMWQYARIAKFVIQRTEAGQPMADALRDVMEQTQTIIQGICEQNPPTSKDADVDAATKAFFFLYAPKSTSRERGPKSEQTAD